MKDSKFAKLIAVISAVVLLIGAVVGVTVLADDSSVSDEPATASAGIVSTNLNYAARLEIVFAVSAEGLADNADVVMLFYKSNPEAEGELTAEELYTKAYYRKTAAPETVKVNGTDCLIFTSRGIAATEAASSFYAIPVIRYDNGEAGVSYERGYTRRTASSEGYIYEYGARKFGVELYAIQKLVGETKPTAAQESLYNSIIDYAKATTVRFGNTYVPDYAFLKVTGASGLGVFDNGVYNDVSGMGDSLTLTAPKLNAAGVPFDYWMSSDGTKVDSLTVDVALTAGMVEEYAAVYGANRVVYDFDSYNPEDAFKVAGDWTWMTTTSNTGILNIVDQGNGDKALTIGHESGKSGYCYNFNVTGDTVRTAKGVMLDFDYTECKSDNVDIYMAIGVTDGTTTANLRLNIRMKLKGSPKAARVYADNQYDVNASTYRPLKDQNSNGEIDFSNKHITVIYNDETIALDYYFNGEYYASLSLEDFATAKVDSASVQNTIRKVATSAEEGKNITISYLRFGSMSSGTDTITIDNIVFDDNFYLAD